MVSSVEDLILSLQMYVVGRANKNEVNEIIKEKEKEKEKEK